MAAITGTAPIPPPGADARMCSRCGTVHVRAALVPPRNPEAYARMCPKLAALGERIEDMPEDDYGRWLNALPFDEFLEFIVLDEACIAALMRSPLSLPAAGVTS